MKKTINTLVILTLMLGLMMPAAGLAENAYGAAAVKEGETYTLEQMLTYAIQDEYLAQADYQAFVKAFGANTAFANFERAETVHIARLTQLFEARGLPLPENTAADMVQVPATLQLAYQEEVGLEARNIAMYEQFLQQNDLPEDVKLAFTALRNASQNHLAAAQRNVARGEGGQGWGRQDSPRRNDNTVKQPGGRGPRRGK